MPANGRRDLTRRLRGLKCAVGSQTLRFLKIVSVWDPTAHFKHCKCGSVFLEGPEDDSIRIETCCPNTIINTIKFCCVWLIYHCVFIYVLNTSGWQTLKKVSFYINNNNLLQLGCHPVAVVILHVCKIWNWLLINLSREGYMRSM